MPRQSNARQPNLNFYGKGIYKTRDGHLRYHSPKELRNKYVHRVVIEKLIEEMPDHAKSYIPWPYEVHHMDFDKAHNCPRNLLLLSVEFHAWITAQGRRGPNGRLLSTFHPVWKVPDWKLFDEDDEAIPF